MKNVCFVGVKNIFFEKTVLKFIDDYIYVSEDQVKVSALKKGGLLIYDTCGQFTDIGANYDLLVFKNDFFEPFDYRKRLKRNGAVFLSEGCPRAAKSLERAGIKYNVCGMDRSCGITPSSITDDSLTVSLKTILSAEGRIICEEDEFKIRGTFNVYNICPAMMGSAVERLVYCGDNFVR